MNNLIPLTTTNEGTQAVMGRDLHEFLEIGRDYTNWFKQMAEYGFEEGQDYVIKNEQALATRRNRVYERRNHILTMGMAKKIASYQRNYAGERVLAYLSEGRILAAKSTRRPESLVYFIHAPEVSTVKIGVSINVEKRLNSLKTMSPARLHLLAVEQGGLKREGELHRMFATYRSHGEWFHMSPKVENYISNLTARKVPAHV